jgi:YD repeat-containing protein
MKNILLFLLFICFYETELCAQSKSNNVIGPSPNAAAFDKYGNIPVSTYTGIPDISIPIYTITHKDIKVPITLRYHAGGIQVSEEASRVGLGWTLNAGGIINHQVNGDDDFNLRGYVKNPGPTLPFSPNVTSALRSNSTNTIYPNAGLCEKTIADNTINFEGYLGSSMYGAGGVMGPTIHDFEPDSYSYHFLNYDGKFMVKKNKEIVKEKEDELKIILLGNQYSNDGSAFKMITKDGTSYFFDKKETCHYFTGDNVNGDLYAITSLYLTKIKSVKGDSVLFHYSTTAGSNGSYTGIYTQTLFDWTEKTLLTYKQTTGLTESYIPPPYVPVVYPSTREYDMVKLEAITYPQGSVVFSYDSRMDLRGDLKLSTINVNYTSDPSKNTMFVLDQDYFQANAGFDAYPVGPVTTEVQNYIDKRLRLKGVYQQSLSSITNQRYQFKYDTAAIPPKNSLGRDHWGFFNGAHNSKLLPTIIVNHPYFSGNYLSHNGGDRSVNPAFSHAFVLTDIKYPTGGHTRFDYQQNDYDPANSLNPLSMYSNGTNITKNSQTFNTRTGLTGTFSYQMPVSADNNTVALYIRSQGGQVGTQPAPSPGNAYIRIYPQGSSTAVFSLDLSNVSIWTSIGSGTYTYNIGVNLPKGDYTISTYFSQSMLFLAYMDFTLSYYHTGNDLENHEIELGGGLRVSRITDIDNITTKNSIRKFVYHNTKTIDGVSKTFSYGRRMASLKYTGTDDFEDCKQREHGGGVSANAYSYALYNLYSSSTIPLLSPIVSYDNVTILYGENGENGKTTFQYTNVPELELAYSYLRPLGMPNLLNLENGLLRKQVDYRFNQTYSTFECIRESETNYISSPTSTQVAVRRISEVRSPWMGLCSFRDCSWILAQYPAFQSCWTHPTTETVKEYIPGSTNYIQTVKSYQYEDVPTHYQALKTEFSSSNNLTHTTVNLFPTDYQNGTTFIDDLKAANIVTPIEQVEYQTRGNDVKITSGKFFKYYEGGKGLLQSESKLETLIPVDLANFKFSNQLIGKIPDGSTKVAFFEDGRYNTFRTYSYDSNNNTSMVVTNGARPTTYLWSYNGMYPVAEITNASYPEVEAVLSKAAINNFKVSTPNSYSQILEFLAPLRVSLPSTQITVYTYIPVIGMASMTDPRGQTTFYEYDNFQRLKTIKDSKGNLVQQVDYNYKNQ